MKIAIFITAFPPSIGGAQIHTQIMAKELSTTNVVKVFSLWDKNRTDWLLGTTLKLDEETIYYTMDGIDVTKFGLPVSEKCKLLPSVISYILFQRNAIDKISQVFIDQFFSNFNGFDLIHNIRVGREPFSYASYKLAKKLSIPFVFTPLHHPRWTTRFHKPYIRLYKLADVILALTNHEKQTLSDLGVNPKKIFVTGIGPVLSLSNSAAKFRTKYNLADKPVILFLGQKYQYKGVGTIVDATERVWMEVPDAIFIFIGPRTNYSKALFTNIKDPRIIEIGIVDLQDKTDAITACDIMCVPSTQESFGGIYTEAWWLKKPVIGCNIPTVSEVIDHGVDGLLVSQTPESLANAIITLLKNPSEAQDMGENGFLKVQSKFTWEIIAKRTEEAYSYALEKLFPA